MTNAHHILLANQLRNLRCAIHARRGRALPPDVATEWETALDKIADELDGPWFGEAGCGQPDEPPTDRGRGLEP